MKKTLVNFKVTHEDWYSLHILQLFALRYRTKTRVKRTEIAFPSEKLVVNSTICFFVL